ncbi:ABC transporter ATP-binding protein/permease [Amylibacter sp.]|nr:ABC transporter ATP-binding protein/permease [Amylibacter sp.]
MVVRIFFKNIKIIVGKNGSPYLIILIFLLLALLDVLGISMVPVLIGTVLAEEPSETVDLINSLLPTSIMGDDIVWVFSVIIVLIFSAKSLIYIMSNYMINKFSYTVMHKNRHDLISLLLNSRYESINNKSAADFINLIQLHINQTVSNYLVPALKIFSDTLVAIFIIIYLLISNLTLTLLLLGVTSILSYAYLQFFRNSLYEYGKKSYGYNHAMIDLAKSIRGGFVDIIMNGGTPYFKRLFHDSSLRYSQVNIKSATIRVIPRPLLEWVVILFVVLLIAFNSNPEHKTEIITILATFGMAALRLLPAATSIISSLTSMTSTKAVVEKYINEKNLLIAEQNNNNESKDLDLNSKTVDRSKTISDTVISANSMSFYHEPDNYLLNDINLVLKKGSTIGIVGLSGSGKSTLVSLILGLLKPIKGNVCIDNINVLDLDTSKYFSYVSQFPFISNDTLLNNLVYPGCDLNKKEIINLMDLIGLADLTNGNVATLDDLVGEKGISLSGGQIQRIAIIRAIIQNKKILIIDEGTSALDHESSNRVLDILSRIKKNKIILVISHRKEILKMCEHVYKLENGSLKKTK